MLTLQASPNRLMVLGFGTLPSSELTRQARRAIRAVLDPVSQCLEPDRVYYSDDGKLDAASWGIAQGTVDEAISRVRAACLRLDLSAASA